MLTKLIDEIPTFKEYKEDHKAECFWNNIIAALIVLIFFVLFCGIWTTVSAM